jgi:hypothetical protein
MMMANALTSAFGGKQGSADAAASGDKASLADTAPADGATDDASITNSLYENPDDQSASFDDFGGDGGDEGDWA